MPQQTGARKVRLGMTVLRHRGSARPAVRASALERIGPLVLDCHLATANRWRREAARIGMAGWTNGPHSRTSLHLAELDVRTLTRRWGSRKGKLWNVGAVTTDLTPP